jgi:uncharacterized RDD family membrane protein YckC
MRRLGALLYDGLLVIAILMIAAAIATIVSKVTSGSSEPYKTHVWLFRAWLLLCVFVFFAWFWTHGGQTLGMRAWKLRLQQADGSNIGWLQAVLRFVSACLTLGLGLLWVLVDQRKRSLYDRISHSEVVLVESGYVPPLASRQ